MNILSNDGISFNYYQSRVLHGLSKEDPQVNWPRRIRESPSRPMANTLCDRAAILSAIEMNRYDKVVEACGDEARQVLFETRLRNRFAHMLTGINRRSA